MVQVFRKPPGGSDDMGMPPSAERIAAVGDLLAIPIWVGLPDGRTLWVNRAWEEFFGRSREEVSGLLTRELGATLPAGEPDSIQAQLAEWERQGRPDGRRVDFTMVRPSGERRSVTSRLTALRGPGGEVEAVLGLHIDDSERVRADHALHLTEGRLRTLVENAPSSIRLLGPDGTCHYVNPAWTELFGIPAEAVVGQPPGGWLEVVHPEDRGDLGAQFARWQESGHEGRSRWQGRIVAPDGRVSWVHTQSVAHRDPDGTLRGIVVNTLDISDVVNALGELRVQEERFRAMADAGPAMITLADVDGSVTAVNAGAREFTGLPEDRLVRDGWMVAVHPEDRRWLSAEVATGVAAARAMDVEYRLRRHDGVHRWVLSRAAPYAAGGEHAGWVTVTIDVHDLHIARAEQAARRRIATAVADDAWLPRVLALIATEAAVLVGGGVAELGRADAGGGVEHLGSWRADGTRVATESRTSRIGERAVVTGRPATAPSGREGISTAHAVPLVVDGRVWGYLEVRDAPDPGLPDDGLETLTVFADFCGMAIWTASERQQLDRRTAELEAVVAAVPDLVMRFGADGLCRMATAPAGRLALIADLLDGADLPGVLGPGAWSALSDAAGRAQALRAPQQAEFHIALDGGRVLLQARVAAIRDDEVLATVRDVAEEA